MVHGTQCHITHPYRTVYEGLTQTTMAMLMVIKGQVTQYNDGVDVFWTTMEVYGTEE